MPEIFYPNQMFGQYKRTSGGVLASLIGMLGYNRCLSLAAIWSGREPFQGGRYVAVLLTPVLAPMRQQKFMVLGWRIIEQNILVSCGKPVVK